MKSIFKSDQNPIYLVSLTSYNTISVLIGWNNHLNIYFLSLSTNNPLLHSIYNAFWDFLYNSKEIRPYLKTGSNYLVRFSV
jgi:hypothetical protein